MQLSLAFHWAIDTSIDEVYKLILWTHLQFETAGNYIKNVQQTIQFISIMILYI